LNFEFNQPKSKKIWGNQRLKRMTHGGKRPGAGRKKGSLSQKTRAIAARAAADGITPLEVMLNTMRSAWARASRNGETVTSFKDALIAVAMAEKAAPYVHPRLAAERRLSDEDRESLPPQVHIYLPDNGRDPDFVTPEIIDPAILEEPKLNGHGGPAVITPLSLPPT
jgi:hypothetical protein